MRRSWRFRLMAIPDHFSPSVSIILTTRDRPRLLPVALACYRHQTYSNRELIVVDDGELYPADAQAVAEAGGRLIRVVPGTMLGAKLNRGLEEAQGEWCQKMDDDDWYAPDFLERMIAAVAEDRREICRPVFAILVPFLFFEVARWEVRRSIRNNAPGATLLFAREDWREQPFRAVPQDEDVWFFRDRQHAGVAPLRVRALESFLAVRHQGTVRDRGHTWTRQGDGQTLEDYLHDRPLYRRSPDDLLPEWALAIYRELHSELRRASK